jgi:hypothetical protein
MKSRISLAVVALLATTGLFAQKTFNFSEHGFNIPIEGLKVGDTFTITNIIDPEQFSKKSLMDAAGKVWALKTFAQHDYSGTSGTTFTFRVVAIPESK